MTPTNTILPRFRLIRAAWLMMSSDLAEAVIKTASAPIPSVCDSTNFTTSSFLGLQVITPHFLANSNFAVSKSIPITLQPLAMSN